MGSKKSSTKVYDYLMSIHFGICLGAINSLNRIFIKDRVAWSGNLAGNGSFTINLPDFFGGDEKEGGVVGTVDIRVGDDTQTLSGEAAARFGKTPTTMPGFRGIANIFFRGLSSEGFKWATNNPYLPNVWINVTRLPVGLDATYAAIANDEATQYDENATGTDLKPATGAIPTATPAVNSSLPQHQTYLTNFPAWTRVGGNSANGWASVSSGFRAYPGTIAIGGKIWRDYSLADLGLSASDVDTGKVTLRLTGTATVVKNNSAVPDGVFSAGLRQLPAAGYAYSLSSWSAKSSGAVDAALSVTSTGQVSAAIPLASGTRTVRVFVGIDLGAVGSGVGSGSYAQITDLKVTKTVGIERPDANPAHIVYECMTGGYGMRGNPSQFDLDVWNACARTLYNEGFGLSLQWTQQTSVENFTQEILDHIQASIYVRPSTGLWEMKLWRGDYDVGTLKRLTPDNCTTKNRVRRLWGETTNEITVTYTDPRDESERSLTFQDLANAQTQGATVASTRNYYGIRKTSLANTVGLRDLRQTAYPLFSCDVEADRTLGEIVPGDVLLLDEREDGIVGMPVRVGKVNYGKPGSRVVRFSVTEDVFGLELSTYTSAPTTNWIAPPKKPTPFEFVEFHTAPLPLLLRSGFNLADISADDYPRVVVGVLADSRSRAAFAFDLYGDMTAPNGDVSLGKLATLPPTTSGVLSAALALEATSSWSGTTVLGFTGGFTATGGDFFQIGSGDLSSEVVMLQSYDSGTDTWTVARGMFDTVPLAWDVGTRVWSLQDDAGPFDPTEQAALAAARFRLLPSVGSATMPVGDAADYNFTPSERPYLPFRPANVQIDGHGFGDTIYHDLPLPTSVTVTWATRNRLSEDTIAPAWAAAASTPESGQTTTIRLKSITGTLLSEITGLTGNSYTLLASALPANGKAFVEVLSARDGFKSLHSQTRFVWVGVAGYGNQYGRSYGH